MSDGGLVLAVLALGGAAFLTIFLSITVTSVRRSSANDPPPGHSH